jgi:putative Holliday junction resolvase
MILLPFGQLSCICITGLCKRPWGIATPAPSPSRVFARLVYHRTPAGLGIAARKILPSTAARTKHTVKPRILAIDFGTKRMGLAISDPLGITAQGLPTLERTRIADDLERLRLLVEEYAVERVLVGNPIGHSGAGTGMSQQVAEFVEKLARRLPCPVELRDERLTSAEANRVLRSSGISIGKRQRAVDRMSAVLLLQSYLDYLENERYRRGGTEG